MSGVQESILVTGIVTVGEMVSPSVGCATVGWDHRLKTGVEFKRQKNRLKNCLRNRLRISLRFPILEKVKKTGSLDMSWNQNLVSGGFSGSFSSGFLAM